MSKKNTKVSIVGWAANTRGHAPFDDDTWDIWGCNEVGMSGMPGKRFTAHYNLHTPKELNKEQFAPNMEWLRGRSEPVWILPGCEALVPNAKVYPVADMFAKYGKYFTNSISYMLVHAIEQGYKNIALYGIDMAMDSEYQYQRPCVEYYIGLARGMGIVVDIPPDSAILSFPWIYGVQDAPTTEGIVSEATLREKGRELEVQFKKDQESAMLHRGALQMNDFWLRMVRMNKRDMGYPELPGEVSREEMHKEMMSGPQSKPNKST